MPASFAGRMVAATRAILRRSARPSQAPQRGGKICTRPPGRCLDRWPNTGETAESSPLVLRLTPSFNRSRFGCRDPTSDRLAIVGLCERGFGFRDEFLDDRCGWLDLVDRVDRGSGPHRSVLGLAVEVGCEHPACIAWPREVAAGRAKGADDLALTRTVARDGPSCCVPLFVGLAFEGTVGSVRPPEIEELA